MLPDHYEQLAKTVRDFAQSVVAPVAAKARRRALVPVRGGVGDGRHGVVRPAVPRGVRRHGRRLLRAVPGAGGTRQGRPERGDHAGGRRLAGRDAGVPLRQRGAEAGMVAAAWQAARRWARSA